MLTLFHAPKSRSSRFIWLLEEIGAPYEINYVNIRRGDGSGAQDDQNPHPHGKTPALIHDGSLIFESTAIALYLSDLFPEAGLGPKIGDPGRGPFLSWLAYYTGVMEPAFVSKFMRMDVPRGTAGWVNTDEVMANVNAALRSRPYIIGEKFSAADVLYGSTFALFRDNPVLTVTSELAAYIDRCAARPALARAMAKDAPQ